MPLYEYVHESPVASIRIERLFRMGEAPDSIEIDVGGTTVNAHRVLSLPAWRPDHVEETQLPPENSPFIP